MIDPASGPFMFETSAESWLTRAAHSGAIDSLHADLARHEVQVPSITLLERIRS